IDGEDADRLSPCPAEAGQPVHQRALARARRAGHPDDLRLPRRGVDAADQLALSLAALLEDGDRLPQRPRLAGEDTRDEAVEGSPHLTVLAATGARSPGAGSRSSPRRWYRS